MIKNYLKSITYDIFKDTFESIEDLNHDTIYIDGMKLETNANKFTFIKFTFIWKRITIKTRNRTFNHLNDIVIEDKKVSFVYKKVNVKQ